MKLIKEKKVIFDSEKIEKVCSICFEPMDIFETNKCDTCNKPICLDCRMGYLESCEACIKYQVELEENELYLNDWLKTA